jgi:hypothetical protein
MRIIKKLIITILTLSLIPLISFAEKKLPVFLRDRGTGIATSMFGTYVRPKELLIYPFYEFYYDHNAEYDPSEMGYGKEADYMGKFIGHEGLLYIAYGITDWLMIEFEAAAMYATQWKDEDDNTSTMPDSVHEDGIGDVEGQIRWRYNCEKVKVPEFFSYFETVFPVQKNMNRKLIGTSAWEFKLGVGVVKGFKFGTLTGRFAIEYDNGEQKVEAGEYALEYLKKLNDHIRIFCMVEGSQDEVELIPEIQIMFNEYLTWKINCGIGLTPKATDIAPETGMMLSLQFGSE